MKSMSWKNISELFRVFLFLLLLLTACCSCSKKELTINPIKQCSDLDGHIFYEGNDEFHYYTIANYKNFSYDLLYKDLNDYIDSRYSYKRIIETIKDNGRFSAFFYKKSLFANYKRYISSAKNSESGSIYEHQDNLIAQIYCIKEKEKNEDFYVFNTIVYGKNEKLLLKRDTIKHSFNFDRTEINRKFDIATFNQYNSMGKYEFIDLNGEEVRQWVEEFSYIEHCSYPNSPYGLTCVYNNEGDIRSSEKTFYGVLCEMSVYYRNGSIDFKKNNDIPYKFSIHELIEKMEQEYQINLLDVANNNVTRYEENKYINIPLYEVYTIVNNNELSPYRKFYLINGNSGETLYITKRPLNEDDMSESVSILNEYTKSLKNGYKVTDLLKYLLWLIAIIFVGFVIYLVCKKLNIKSIINSITNPNNFFKYNIFIDFVAILLFCILLFIFYHNWHNDLLLSYIEKSYIFFLLHFVFIFLHIFSNKNLKIWKIILYCIFLLVISCIIFIVGYYYAWFIIPYFN